MIISSDDFKYRDRGFDTSPIPILNKEDIDLFGIIEKQIDETNQETLEFQQKQAQENISDLLARIIKR